MNSTTLFLIAFLAITAASAMKLPEEDWETNPLLSDVPAKLLRQLRAVRQAVTKKGCNINVCFALQGGDSITEREYALQKSFVELMVALTAWEAGGNFCAVQYGRTTKMISRLTDAVPRFLKSLRKSRQVGGVSVNIGVALAYAAFQLRTREGEPRKFVILGNGLDNIGPEPIETAKGLRDEGIDICAVAVGLDRLVPALNKVTKDPERVFMVEDYDHLSDVIIGLVNDICHLQD